MNVYSFVVLAALFFEFGLHLTADFLNLRALGPEVPEEFRASVDAERYRRSQEYVRAKTRFGIVSASFDLVLLLAFWFAGGFGWLDGVVRGLGQSEIVSGLVFIGALVVARSIIGIPFAWHFTFGIEERFGFNKTTPRTFVMDRVKSLVLTVLLGAPLLWAILWFFQRTGDAAWLWCWGVTASFVVALQFVAPTWIFPLFNKFSALEEGELREAILGYAKKVSFPLQGLFVIDGSRRSTKSNAFFTGFGKRKRVALYDTLIEGHGTDELVAIVAHEIGHYKRGHIIKHMLAGILQMGVVFFLLSVALGHEGLFAAFFVEQPSIHAGLVFFGLIYAPIDLVLSFFVQASSRRHEFEADRFAKETTGSGGELATALRRLSAENLDNLTPHPFYVALNYSHPPVLRRIEALRG